MLWKHKLWKVSLVVVTVTSTALCSYLLLFSELFFLNFSAVHSYGKLMQTSPLSAFLCITEVLACCCPAGGFIQGLSLMTGGYLMHLRKARASLRGGRVGWGGPSCLLNFKFALATIYAKTIDGSHQPVKQSV